MTVTERPILASIVEGHAEERGGLRVLVESLRPDLELGRPVRVKRDRFLNAAGPKNLEHYVPIALSNIPPPRSGALLILLDAEEDCPAELGPAIRDRATVLTPERIGVHVVLATQMIEAWVIAGNSDGLFSGHSDPEDITNPKAKVDAALRSQDRGKYGEIEHLPGLLQRMDYERAQAKSASFRRLVQRLNAMPR